MILCLLAFCVSMLSVQGQIDCTAPSRWDIENIARIPTDTASRIKELMERNPGLELVIQGPNLEDLIGQESAVANQIESHFKRRIYSYEKGPLTNGL